MSIIENATIAADLINQERRNLQGKSGSYTIPNGITTIRIGAFYGFRNLTTVNIPTSLEIIGDAAFYNCLGLVKINLPNSLTFVGPQSFYNCTGLTELLLEQGFNCNGLNVSMSTLLTAETIVSCLEALSDRTGQAAYTITFGTTNLNKLTAEQRDIATNKNWNLA